MEINKLTLSDFRNYHDETVSFSDGVNIICGDNAQGKTNILEAVHMFSVGKSNRTPRDSELIRHGCRRAEIGMEYTAAGRGCTLDIQIERGKRKAISYNDIALRKISELLGRFNAVYFGPELLGLVKNGPGGRRRNLDMVISQLRPNYFSAVSELKKIVDSKNALLKAQNPNNTMLEIINKKLIDISAEVIAYRCEFVGRLEETARVIQSDISGGSEELSYRYMSAIGRIDSGSVPNKDDIRSRLRDRIEKSAKRETEYRETLISPHREDIAFDINGRDARAFASQGQQKTVALVEKLAETRLIGKETGENPLLLLDDIMSEFDKKRREFILGSISGMQIIITCTDLDGMAAAAEGGNIIRVEDGRILEDGIVLE